MRERQVSRLARRRVLTHVLKAVVNHSEGRSAGTEVYRALKCCAARIPRASLSDIFPGIGEVEVRVKYSPANGGGSLSDVITLAQIVRFLGCQRMFEIGTFRGHTAYHLALNSPAGARVYTLDLLPSGISDAKLELTDLPLIQKMSSGESFRGTECEPKITQLFGDSACFDTTEYDGQMDFVFVDGAHSYSYARSDSEMARRLARPGGLVIWHDYPTYPGVWACLEQLSHEWDGQFVWIDGTALVTWKAG